MVQVAQGAGAAAAMYNFVLQSAMSAGQYTVVLDLLSHMRAAGLEVDPSITASVSEPHPQMGEEGARAARCACQPTTRKVSGLECFPPCPLRPRVPPQSSGLRSHCDFRALRCVLSASFRPSSSRRCDPRRC